MSLLALLIKLEGGILSKTGGEVFREDSGRVWCCWGYRLSLFGFEVLCFGLL